MKNSSTIQRSVAFFPSVAIMSGNPYWTILAAEIEKLGVKFYHDTPVAFTARWLLNHRKQVGVLHLHYCQQFYTVRRGKTHLAAVLRFAFNLLLARVLGYRTVFTLHNSEPTYQLEPAWVDYIGHWVAANFTNRVIVHCNCALQLLAKRFGRHHNVFIVEHPNLINCYPNTISKEAAREVLDLSSNFFVFTFFGGVRPNKGIETLIKAFISLRGENLRLVIAGKKFPPDSYAQSLQELSTGDDRINFHLRHIPDEEIQLFMNSADVVVLPFTRILTSSSAHLAMSFERPLILPRIGCLPELVEPDGGWIYDPDDVNSLAMAMQAAMVSDIRQIGQSAYEKIRNYSPEHFSQQTAKVYWD